MRLKLLAPTFVAAAMLAGAAQAGDVACLWSHLGKPAQDAWYADYDARGAGSLDENTFSEESLDEALNACGPVSEANQQTAGEALGGYAIEQAAARWLRMNSDLTTAKLDATWNGLPADVRGGFSAWVIALTDNPDREAPVPEDEIRAIFAALGATDERIVEHVSAYYAGRVMRMDRAPKF